MGDLHDRRTFGEMIRSVGTKPSLPKLLKNQNRRVRIDPERFENIRFILCRCCAKSRACPFCAPLVGPLVAVAVWAGSVLASMPDTPRAEIEPGRGWQGRSWQVERWATRRFMDVTFLCESGACIRRSQPDKSPHPLSPVRLAQRD